MSSPWHAFQIAVELILLVWIATELIPACVDIFGTKGDAHERFPKR